MANTIIHSNNPIIRIINTTDHSAIISNELKEVDNLDIYDIFKINDVKKTRHRREKLENIFKNDTPHDKLELIKNLCKEYTDIFTLETDDMTTNNFYEQKIRITDDTCWKMMLVHSQI